MPRLVDVADRAGVSQATASRVLNGRQGVSDQARRRVLHAAESLGYERTRPLGRQLVGVIVPELENPIFAAYAQQLTALLAGGGCVPMLCSQTASGTSEDEWIEMLLDQEAGGLVVVSGMHADTHASLDRYRRLRGLRLPLVLVNGFVQDLDASFVSDDDVAAMQLAVSHLASLGHTRIGLAIGPERYVPVIRKVGAFASAVAQARLDEPLVEYSLFTIEGGHAAAARLLEQGVTAIVCGSDFMALGAMRACRARGLAVPDDVSVVGYDDTPLVAFTGPPLTTVRQAVGAMSKAAVRLLLDELEGRPVPRHEYLFPPELVVRGSTGAAPGRPRR